MFLPNIVKLLIMSRYFEFLKISVVFLYSTIQAPFRTPQLDVFWKILIRMKRFIVSKARDHSFVVEITLLTECDSLLCHLHASNLFSCVSWQTVWRCPVQSLRIPEFFRSQSIISSNVTQHFYSWAPVTKPFLLM